MSDVNPPALEAALAHTGFVVGLARALLGADPQLDDVVQDTWLVAAQGGPDDPTRMKGWLGGIVRRLSAGVIRKRATERRHAPHLRERVDAPSTEEVVAREEMRREVVQAMLRLKEPYRSALLLRYYEDLPPREVAKRLGVPVETARTRIKRGLALLRTELDRRPGGRASWTPLVGSLADFIPAGTSAGASSGAGLGLLAVAVLAAVGVGIGVWLGTRDDERAPADPPTGNGHARVEPTDEPEGATLVGSADADSAVRSGEVPSGRSRIAGRVRRGTQPVVATVGLHYVDRAPTSFGKRMAATKNEEVVVRRPADRTLEAGARGEFAFEGLGPGVYIVSVAAAPGRVATRVAFVEVDGLRVDGSIELPNGEERLDIIARHGDGPPYEGIVHVQQRDREKGNPRRANTVVRTNAEGRATLDGMLADDVFIEIRKGRVDTWTRVKLPSKEPVELVVGRTGHVLRGRVRAREGGAPIAGAIVTVRIQARAPEVPGRESKRVRTDANGAFEVAFGKGYGEINVIVEAPGWSTAWIEWDRTDAPVTLELDPETRISGRVVSASGAPLPGVVVVGAIVRGRYLSGEWEVRTGAGGAFSLGGLEPAKQFVLFVRGPGWASAELGSATVGGRNPFLRDLPAAGLSGVELVASKLAEVTGRVVDDQGRGVGGVYVRLVDPARYGRREGNPLVSITDLAATRDDGRFTLRDAVPGRPWAVQVEGPEIVETTSPPVRLDEPVTVQVTRLAHDRDLLVRVVGDDDERSIEGVHVRVVSTRGGSWSSIGVQGKTNADGRVWLSPVPVSNAGVLLSGPHVEWNETPTPIPPSGNGAVEMTIKTPRRFQIAGTVVVTPHGMPEFVMAEVKAQPIDEEGRLGNAVRGRLDEDTGRFFVGPLTSGRWRVQVDLDGKRRTMDLEAGRTDAAMEIEWDWKGDRKPEPEPEHVRVRFVLQGPNGARVPKARYRSWLGGFGGGGPVRGGERFVNYHGKLPEGVVEFLDARDAAGERLGYGAVVLPPGAVKEGDNVVRLQPEKTIQGRVTVSGSAAPAGTQVAAHVVVTWKGEDHVSREPHDRSVTDAKGRFRLRGLGPYRYALRTSGSGGLEPASEITADAGSQAVAIELKAAASPTIRVTREDGSPIAGLFVRALPEGREPDPFGDRARATDVAGRVKIRGLDPNRRYVLQVLANPKTNGVFGVSKEGWTPTDTTIVLERAYRIAGVVRAPDGTPVQGASIVWKQAPGRWRPLATTDAAGRFQAHGVVAEGVEIEARVGEQRSSPVNAVAGARDVAITLDPGSTFTVRMASWPWERVNAASLSYRAIGPDGRDADRANRGGPGVSKGEVVFKGRARDAEWTFFWSGLPDGKVGWLRGARPTVGDTVSVPLFDAQVLDGRVEIPEGVSHEHLHVEIWLANHRVTGPVAEDGSFRVEGLPPGEVEARVCRRLPPGEYVYGEPVVVRPGDAPVLEVPDAK